MKNFNTDILKNKKVLGCLFLILICIIAIVFTLNKGPETTVKENEENNIGFIEMTEDQIARRIDDKDSFVLVACSSSSTLCNDLTQSLKSTEIVEDTQMVFLDLANHVESIKSASAEDRDKYIFAYNKTMAKFSIKKVPTIQLYVDGKLEDNVQEIFSNKYLTKSKEEQTTELEKIKTKVEEWYIERGK